MRPIRYLTLTVAVIVLAGAAVFALRHRTQSSSKPPSPAASPLAESTSPATALVLTSLGGSEKIDAEIAALQAKVRETPTSAPALERLGWAFVTKARLANDPGFYKLAEQCAVAIGGIAPHDPGADLLRGHIDHALHRFHDAEAIARRLTGTRDFVFDYALLGDALMEQGKLPEAVEAYQKMVDLKPCLQTYSRVAHMRWLKGDLPGAIAAARLAVSSGTPREPEPLAWAATRLSFYLLQQNELAPALAATDEALHYAPNYAPALLSRGRIFLAQNDLRHAAESLKIAAQLSPLPEYLWTYAEAARADGQASEADAAERTLSQTGAANDPRTFALFLASRGLEAPVALQLARAELKERADVFTHDAVAWAEFASGHLEEATTESAFALVEGTGDPRLYLHAGTIAAAAGKTPEALALLQKANERAQALLPSERIKLREQLASKGEPAAHTSSR